MRAIVCAIALTLSGCATSVAQPDVPAIIAGPTAESRAELRAAVASVLKVPDVTLADDALTRDSTLIIERTTIRDAHNRPLTGRDYGKPHVFDLVMSAGQCVLVNRSDASRTVLTKAAGRPR